MRAVCLGDHTCKHPYQKLVRSFISLEHVLVNHLLVSLFLHFLLEENKIIAIVPLVSEILGILGRVTEVLDNILVQRYWGSLVGCIVFVLLFEYFWRGAESKDRAEMVNDMVYRDFLVAFGPQLQSGIRSK